MKVKVYQGFYVLTASAHDTEAWATKPGAAWPCSTLRGKRVRVTVDDTGLCGIAVNGRETGHNIDGHELDAFVSDCTAGTEAAAYWPRWGSL